MNQSNKKFLVEDVKHLFTIKVAKLVHSNAKLIRKKNARLAKMTRFTFTYDLSANIIIF